MISGTKRPPPPHIRAVSEALGTVCGDGIPAGTKIVHHGREPAGRLEENNFHAAASLGLKTCVNLENIPLPNTIST